MHKKFYENELTREVVEKMAEDVEQIIAKLKGGDDMTMELLSKFEIAREKNFSLRDNLQAYRMLP